MSKSYGNTILLTEPEADLRAKLKTMVTDPARVRRTDPGNPDVCPVFDLHKVFSTERDPAEGPPKAAAPPASAASSAKAGSPTPSSKSIAPIQERRRILEADPGKSTPSSGTAPPAPAAAPSRPSSTSARPWASSNHHARRENLESAPLTTVIPEQSKRRTPRISPEAATNSPPQQTEFFQLRSRNQSAP